MSKNYPPYLLVFCQQILTIIRAVHTTIDNYITYYVTKILRYAGFTPRFDFQVKLAQLACGDAARNFVLTDAPCLLVTRGGCATVLKGG